MSTRHLKDLLTNKPIEPIIRQTLPFDEYVKWPAINNSSLSWFAGNEGCPLKFQHRYLCGHSFSSKATLIGSVFHSLILEPKRFDQEFVILTAELKEELYEEALELKSRAKGFSTALTTYKKWLREQTRTVVDEKDLFTAQAMAERLMQDDDVVAAFAGFEPQDYEVSVMFSWPLTREKYITCKARLDLANEWNIIDLKSSRISNAYEFAKSVKTYSYHRQMGFYRTAWTIARKAYVRECSFFAQEKEAPYCLGLHDMPDDWVDLGELAAVEILTGIAECIESDRWPHPGRGMLLPPEDVQRSIEIQLRQTAE